MVCSSGVPVKVWLLSFCGESDYDPAARTGRSEVDAGDGSNLVDRCVTWFRPYAELIKQLYSAYYTFKPRMFVTFSRGGSSAWVTTSLLGIVAIATSAASFYINPALRHLDAIAIFGMTFTMSFTTLLCQIILPWLMLRYPFGRVDLNTMLNQWIISTTPISIIISGMAFFVMSLHPGLETDIREIANNRGDSVRLYRATCGISEAMTFEMRQRFDINQITQENDRLIQYYNTYGSSIPESIMVLEQARIDRVEMALSESERGELRQIRNRHDVSQRHLDSFNEDLLWMSRATIDLINYLYVLLAVSALIVAYGLFFLWTGFRPENREERFAWGGRFIVAYSVSFLIFWFIVQAQQGGRVIQVTNTADEVAAMETTARKIEFLCGRINSHGLW